MKKSGTVRTVKSKVRTAKGAKVKVPVDMLVDLPSKEACKYGPYGTDDVPCKVRFVFGAKPEVEEWKSRKAASAYYGTIAHIGGSEGDRYGLIADYLVAGCTDVCDNQDRMTAQMLDVVCANFPNGKEMFAAEYEYARKAYAN